MDAQDVAYHLIAADALRVANNQPKLTSANIIAPPGFMERLPFAERDLPLLSIENQLGVPVFSDPSMPRGMGIMRGAGNRFAILDLRTPDEKAEDAERYGRPVDG